MKKNSMKILNFNQFSEKLTASSISLSDLESVKIDRKYHLDLDDSIEYKGHTLCRIIADKDFDDVKTGRKGGYVESENNLSQDT